jgi:hypothetical protein
VYGLVSSAEARQTQESNPERMYKTHGLPTARMLTCAFMAEVSGFDSDRTTRLFRGIEAGVVGGIAMIGFLIVASTIEGERWWQVPNLFGSTFYGNRAFRTGASMSTLSGAALHFVITGTIGAAFGWTCGGMRKSNRLFLVGVLVGLAWHYLGPVVFWARVNPRVPAYSSETLMLFGHLLFGACLGPIVGTTFSQRAPAQIAESATAPIREPESLPDPVPHGTRIDEVEMDGIK